MPATGVSTRRPWHSTWMLWGLLTLMLGMPGCGGCTQAPITKDEDGDRREEIAKKKKEKEKPPFEFKRLAIRPYEPEGLKEIPLKPGHWASAQLNLIANQDDFRGDLRSEMVDRVGRPHDLGQTPFHFLSTRPAVLPKGQLKTLDLPVFLPLDFGREQLATDLLNEEGGRSVLPDRSPIVRMPAHQFHLVVLSDVRESYLHLKQLDSVTHPSGLFAGPSREANYRVYLARVDKTAPLPANALDWTAIAVVLWDNANPAALNAEQQQAMLDWLHWGGQLLVSGPGTLDSLRGTFLEPYLPATGGESWKLENAQLAELNAAWNHGAAPLAAVPAWTGQRLVPHASATVLAASGNDPLVVERSVGRGRVVLTAFRLAQEELRNWPNYDEFFSTCLLHRPGRAFSVANGELVVRWMEGGRYNARHNSRLRYVTRDSNSLVNVLSKEEQIAWESQRGQRDARLWQDPSEVVGDSILNGGLMGTTMQPYQTVEADEPPPGAGAAGWDDLSAASEVARSTLRNAAGILVPDASFVFNVVWVYVLVLVPLNWLIFRALGKVEWAWAMAPVVSLVCAVAVVYLAQLDIGFVRSKTELAIVETHAGYPRGHVTRYTALYSSLGTSYDLRFDDSTAQALPFPVRWEVLPNQARTNVTFRRVREVNKEGEEQQVSQVTLSDFEVTSNTTGMIHSEHMLQMGGTFALQDLGNQRYRVTNDTQQALEAGVLFGHQTSGWLGALRPGDAVDVTLTANGEEMSWAKSWAAAKADAGADQTEGLDVLSVYRLVQADLVAGELRLVAWTPTEIPGVSITPGIAQQRHAAVYVVHLQQPALPPLARDSNARSQLQDQILEAGPDEELPPELQFPATGF